MRAIIRLLRPNVKMEKHFHRFIQETVIHGNAFIWNMFICAKRNVFRFAKDFELTEWGKMPLKKSIKINGLEKKA